MSYPSETFCGGGVFKKGGFVLCIDVYKTVDSMLYFA
jgi:hypothetical protein